MTKQVKKPKVQADPYIGLHMTQAYKKACKKGYRVISLNEKLPRIDESTLSGGEFIILTCRGERVISYKHVSGNC
jgi:hypothetical protein